MSDMAKSQPGSSKHLHLERQRAQDAWNKVGEAKEQLKRHDGEFDKYESLAKGLPALVMNSGLMQVLAFLRAKSLNDRGQVKLGDHHHWLGEHLRSAIHARFADIPEDFDGCMRELMRADSRTYQMITTEAVAWLKWLRLMSSARKGD